MQRQLPRAIPMHNRQFPAEMTLQCIELVTFGLILPNCNHIFNSVKLYPLHKNLDFPLGLDLHLSFNEHFTKPKLIFRLGNALKSYTTKSL